MSGMSKGIFRPGAGNLIRKFTAGIAEESIYPNDWVGLSPTANSGQGPAADGVFEGETLGTNDFCYLTLLDTDDNCTPGNQLGVAMGTSVTAVGNFSLVTGDVVAADSLVIVQCWGVHPAVRTDGSAAVTQEYLQPGATAGEAVTAAAGAGTDAVNGSYENIGIALGTDAAYTRATASDEAAGVAFVRCNF